MASLLDNSPLELRGEGRLQGGLSSGQASQDAVAASGDVGATATDSALREAVQALFGLLDVDSSQAVGADEFAALARRSLASYPSLVPHLRRLAGASDAHGATAADAGSEIGAQVQEALPQAREGGSASVVQMLLQQQVEAMQVQLEDVRLLLAGLSCA